MTPKLPVGPIDTTQEEVENGGFTPNLKTQQSPVDHFEFMIGQISERKIT